MIDPYQPPKSISKPAREEGHKSLSTPVRMAVSCVGAIGMGLFLFMISNTPAAILIFILPAFVFGFTYWFQIHLSQQVVMNTKLGILVVLSAIGAGIVFIPACTYTSVITAPLFETIGPSVAYAPPLIGMAVSTFFWAFVFCELGGYTLTRLPNAPKPSPEYDFTTTTEGSRTESDS